MSTRAQSTGRCGQTVSPHSRSATAARGSREKRDGARATTGEPGGRVIADIAPRSDWPQVRASTDALRQRVSIPHRAFARAARMPFRDAARAHLATPTVAYRSSRKPFPRRAGGRAAAQTVAIGDSRSVAVARGGAAARGCVPTVECARTDIETYRSGVAELPRKAFVSAVPPTVASPRIVAVTARLWRRAGPVRADEPQARAACAAGDDRRAGDAPASCSWNPRSRWRGLAGRRCPARTRR